MPRLTTSTLSARIDALQAQLDAYTAQLNTFSANVEAALARVNSAPTTDVPSTQSEALTTDVPSKAASYSLAGRSLYHFPSSPHDVLSVVKAKLEAKYGAYKVVLIKQRKHLVPTVDGAPQIETHVFADRIEFHPV